MLGTSFSSWPSFTEAEAEVAKSVLLSNKVNYWTGVECREFETEFAKWCGVRHGIAVANGTLALELALKGLGIGSGDEVVVTPRTFIASVACVVNVGAIPVFADVEPDSGNISARTIAQVLTRRTKAVICVHLAGWPCDMDPIMKLAEQKNLKVIEDCAQAHGATYKGIGVGAIGHVGAWSFCQDKIMSTGGEGGMVTVNDDRLWQDMWAYKDHGKSFSAVYERSHAPGFRWLHESFGTNMRMIEIQAAIGRLQLRNMSEWTRQRTFNARQILDACREQIALRVEEPSPMSAHAYYKCYVYVRLERLRVGWGRDRIVEAIQAKGVPCYQGSCSEVYREVAFEGASFRPAQRLPVARQLGETSLMFLVHPTLTRAEIGKTCMAIREVMATASQ